jgi:hypothetical protein
MPVIIREYDGAKFTVSKEGDVRCAGDLVFDSFDRLMSDDWTEWVKRIAKGLKREWLALKEREGNWVDKYGRKVECVIRTDKWKVPFCANLPRPSIFDMAEEERRLNAEYLMTHFSGFVPTDPTMSLLSMCQSYIGTGARIPATKPSKWHENCVPIPKGKQVIVRNRIKEYAIMTVCPIGCQWAEIPE